MKRFSANGTHSGASRHDDSAIPRSVREGTNGFTCMPGNPNVIGDPPMCADAASMQWASDFSAHKPKPTNTVPGITYMLAGATQRSDSDPYDKTSPPITVGPHWMIIWPFDAKTTGLPITHRVPARTSCGPHLPTPMCTSWDTRRSIDESRRIEGEPMSTAFRGTPSYIWSS